MKLENLKLNKKLLAALLILIVLPIIILIIIRLTPAYRNMAKLNKISMKIEECNRALNNSINNDSIDIEKAKDSLASGLIMITTLKNDLDAINVDTKNQVLKNKLSETLDYNLSLYELTLSLIKNPNNTDINSKFNEYTKTFDLLKKNYEALSLLGINTKLPKEAENFFSNSTRFINTVIKLNRENDIKVDQKKTYVSSIGECITLFDDIKEDLRPALAKIKEDGRSLDVLLKDIKDKRSKFNNLKTKSYSLSIPENGNECYQSLKDTLNCYELYITSLEHSIVIEKNASDTDKDDNIEKNYENSFSKFEDFSNSLDELRSELDKFNK